MKHARCAGALLVLFSAWPASAHHSFAAEYDGTKTVVVHGTIQKLEWVNPHAWIYVDVKGSDGHVTNWRFELGPPNALFRLGWKKDAVAAGTEVEVSGFRAKAQEAVANGRSITLADGRELFSGGSAPNSEGPDKK